MNIEAILMKVHELKPGMQHVNMEVKALKVSELKQVIAGRGITHEILEVEVGDETGSIMLVLWDEKILLLKAGDFLQIENGFVTSFKGEWRINIGKYGNLTKT
jgi:replication factor A1